MKLHEYAVLAACAPIWAGAAWIALAAPPAGVELPYHAWFEQQRNLRGGSCCGLGDGHVLADDEWRQRGARYEVLVGETWHTVEPGMMRDPAGGPNPTGHAVAWYTVMADGDVRVWCLARGTEW